MSRRRRRRTHDAFTNPAARIGFGTMDLTNGTEYPLTRMTQDYNTLTSLYRDNWIVQNVVATIPNDIIRKWYEVKTAVSPDYLDALKQVERRTKLREKLLAAMYWGRLYGGAVALMMIDGQDDMSLPLELDAVLPGSFQGLQVYDRWSGVYPDAELVDDPNDPEFGLPAYYTIRDEQTLVARVHHSRVIRFIGRELPWLEQVAETYWGESEIESVYNDVVRRDNVAANIAGLTFRANINVMETDGLDQLLGSANTEMQRRFWNVLASQSIMESNFGTRVINKGDAIHNTQYTFTGLPEVYDRVMMDVAGAARTPVTKLFGRSPAGMNATGESDMVNYYDYIDGLRETMFRGVLEKLLPVVCMSAWGQIPDDLEIDFPPMQTADAKETAEIARQKTAAILEAYQNDLIDAATALQELQGLSEETGLFDKITNEQIEAGKGKYYTQTRMMADPMSGLSFGGDTFGTDTTEDE